MNPRRQTIASLMRVVGLVALNLAIGRIIFLFEPWRLAGIGLIAVCIQGGLFFLLRARRLSRPRQYAFWAGFEAASLLGLWSFLYARVPNSRVGALWDEYAAFVDLRLRIDFGLSVLDRFPFDPVLLAAVAVFAFLPQLAMGVGGGLLGLCVAWSKRTLKLFAVVGFLVLHFAAWFAAWVALLVQPPWVAFGATPAGLLLEYGVFRLVQQWKRPRARAFWLGFVGVGSLVFGSYLWAMTFTEFPVARYLRYWPNGPWYAEPVSASRQWILWFDYTAFASYSLGRPPYGTDVVAWSDNPIDALVYALVVFLPHLLSAVAGGLLGLGVVIIRRVARHDNAAGPGATCGALGA